MGSHIQVYGFPLESNINETLTNLPLFSKHTTHFVHQYFCVHSSHFSENRGRRGRGETSHLMQWFLWYSKDNHSGAFLPYKMSNRHIYELFLIIFGFYCSTTNISERLRSIFIFNNKV